MSDKTGIQWTDASWNPIRGCTKVSRGCDICYAMAAAHRMDHPGGAYEGLTRMIGGRPQWNGKVRLVPEKLSEPLRWTKPRMIFVNSMSDLFHESVPDEFIAEVFAVMGCAHWHRFQVLTKRPKRMHQWATRYVRSLRYSPHDEDAQRILEMNFPAPNVWLGISAEDQATADERIPILLDTPAAVRWVSAEPLLGPMELTKQWCDYLGESAWCTEAECCGRVDRRDGSCCGQPDPVQVQTEGLDWVVVGGESGKGARPCDPAWISEIVDQCRAAKVPVFVKQLGADTLGTMNLRHSKGGDIAEWPEHLRIREYPRAVA